MSREEKVDNCGCKLVRSETGLHMEECCLHSSARGMLSALENLITWATGLGYEESRAVEEAIDQVRRAKGLPVVKVAAHPDQADTVVVDVEILVETLEDGLVV